MKIREKMTSCLYKVTCFIVLLMEIRYVASNDEVKMDQLEQHAALTSESTIEQFSCEEKMSKVYHEKEVLYNENKKLQEIVRSLEEKQRKMQSRHSDMIIAWSWQYDQLERKAQAYYNSFQTQKASLGTLQSKTREPNRNRGQDMIFPFLWSKHKQKQQEEALEEALEDGAPQERAIAPPAREHLSTKDVVGLTLKSALSNSERGHASSWRPAFVKRRGKKLTTNIFSELNLKDDLKKAMSFRKAGGIRR